jgi:hypothetical protein
MDELGQRARRCFRPPPRQAVLACLAGLGFLEANIGARL